MPRPKGRRKQVWLAKKFITVRDERTGRNRREPRALVRWREGPLVRERTFPDPIAAGRFASEKIEQLQGQRAVAVDAAAITFDDWKEAYLSSKYSEYIRLKRGEIKKVEDGYLGQLIRASELFSEKVGNRLLCEYKSCDFDRFRALIQADGKHRPATVEGFMMRIRTVFIAAEENGYITRRPKIGVRQVFYEKAVIDPGQLEEIFGAAKSWPATNQLRCGGGTGRLYPVVATLYYTAMRRGELVHLTWSDVRRNEAGTIVEILIQPKEWIVVGADGKRQRMRWEPKDREIRAIPAHPKVVEVLEELAAKSKSNWIFTNTAGEPWRQSSLVSFMDRFEKSSGFKLGFHIWRRSALTHLHDAGVPPGHVQAIAGHSSLSTTMRYVRKSAAGTAGAILALK